MLFDGILILKILIFFLYYKNLKLWTKIVCVFFLDFKFTLLLFTQILRS